ncbi:MAG: hypothetical protein IKB00_02160 [Bacteroidaceae bacterium]|nr:hypothetical protein [Bacteroidaceae bacterium]MBR6856799.1 hypothetical protein [Bacteroidaceae bacterium]
MKMKGFLSVMAAAVMLSLTCASCEKVLDTDTNANDPQNGNDTVVFAKRAEAYLPNYYSDRTIEAWYSVYSENDYKSKVEAVFLFTDSAVAITKSKTYSIEDGREPAREIVALGIYHQLEGDLINGTLRFELSSGFPRNAQIIDGVLTHDSIAYTKQDNANAPAPYQPAAK